MHHTLEPSSRIPWLMRLVRSVSVAAVSYFRLDPIVDLILRPADVCTRLHSQSMIQESVGR